MEITEIVKHPTHIRVYIKGDWTERNSAEEWCIRNECGKRVNLKSFAFKSEKELTMFRLRWVI